MYTVVTIPTSLTLTLYTNPPDKPPLEVDGAGLRREAQDKSWSRFQSQKIYWHPLYCQFDTRQL